jgi:hypothetical protein
MFRPFLIRSVWFVAALGLTLLGVQRSAHGSECGPQTATIPSICGVVPTICTFDDFPAYDICTELPMNNNASDVWSSDGRHTYDTNVGSCVITDNNWGYQCIELPLRYFFFRWGTPHPWSPGFGWAYEMCDNNQAPDITVVTDPVPGDLMVLAAIIDRFVLCRAPMRQAGISLPSFTPIGVAAG